MLRALAKRVRDGGARLMEYVDALSRAYPSATIVLFGSRARGTHLPSSDFDVAIISNGYIDPVEARRLKPRGLPLDLVTLTVDDLNDPIIRSMLSNCVVLRDGLGISDLLIGELRCRPT